MEGIKRGHLKFYILKLLLESRYTGYGLMKKIKEETGFWQPSTGSLYPLLDTMKTQGLITEAESPGGGKNWTITLKGESVYSEAKETKQKLFQSIRNSMLVFAKVFNREDLAAIADRLDQWQRQREDLTDIGVLFMELHDALWSLPPLSTESKHEVTVILQDARDRLTSFRDQATQSQHEEPCSPPPHCR